MRRTALIAFLTIAFASEVSAEVKEVTLSSDQAHELEDRPILQNQNGSAVPRSEDPVNSGADHLTWSFKLGVIGNSCRAIQDIVTIRLTKSLEPWDDRREAPEIAQAAWKDYFDRARAHEREHNNIAMSAAHRLDKMIHGAKGGETCASLDAEINGKAKRIEVEEEQQQAEWDVVNLPARQ